MHVDHVVLACGDLARAAHRLEQETGVLAVPGGRHPGLGTANQVVPLLGGAYLELVGVVDADTARQSSFGRLVDLARRRADRTDRMTPAAWCVAVRDLDTVADRLRLPSVAGSRTRPDGVELHWRHAGVEAARQDPYLPFFIEWDVEPAAHPGAASTPGPAVELVEIRLSGDPDRLSDWLGRGLDLATVVVDDGEPAVRAVVLDVAGRTVVLRGSTGGHAKG